MEKIVLATHNLGKIRELAEPLQHFGLEVLGMDAFPTLHEIEETGVSFEENALLKARSVTLVTGLPAIADDSGLMVDALKGAPGVHSARYSDDWQSLPNESRDQRNIRKLLAMLAHTEQRVAHYVTVMAVCKADGGETLITRGEWSGRILRCCRGTNGFGYDPVFLDMDLNRTAAELTTEEKNARSHRGKALRELLHLLQHFLR